MRKKIDWINHVIAFVSALLGIFIAFQLEDWKENRNENKKIESTLNSIKSEIDSDMAIYNLNIKEISNYVEYVDFLTTHLKDGNIVSTDSDLNNIKAKNPSRFNDLAFLKKLNDSLNVYNFRIIIDFSPVTGISTNNWEAAKSSGTLSLMDHEKVSCLTLIYEWINKDLGFSDTDFYKNMIEGGGKYTDMEQIKIDYKKILDIYKFKKAIIEEKFITMNWDID